MRRRVTVVGSVKSPLERLFVLKILSRTQRATEVGFFSETALLQRSSTPPLKAIHIVGHFPAESAHAYLTTRTR